MCLLVYSLCHLFILYLYIQPAPQPKPMESDKAYWSAYPKLVEDFRVSSEVPLGLTIMTREVWREREREREGGERAYTVVNISIVTWSYVLLMYYQLL